MNYVNLVAILAISQFLFFSIRVGQARVKYKIKAPSISGNEHFERAFRVQMNTLEQLICFLPALFLAASYWPPLYVAPVGAVYLVGRFVYARLYLAKPAQRGIGFLLTVLPTFILLIASLWGVLSQL